MKTLKQIEQLRRVHECIKFQKTGTPEVFADRMHISERQLYNYLEQLKELEAPIQYDRKIQTYFYSAPFELLVNVSVQIILQNELRDIYAGFVYLQEGFQHAIIKMY